MTTNFEIFEAVIGGEDKSIVNPVLIEIFDNVKNLFINNAINEDGYTPFLLACKEGFEANALFLIKKSSKRNLDLSGKDGKTGLMIACQNGFEEIVKELIRNGGDVYYSDFEGNNSLTYALEAPKNHKNIVNMILTEMLRLNNL